MRGLRLLRLLAGLILLAAFGLAIWVRVAPDDPARWHLDPETAFERGLLNDFVLRPGGEGADLPSPIWPESPEALALRLRAVALGWPRTELLSDEGGFATFVTRSKILGLPDYISVKAVAAEGGAALYLHARARYIADDGGENAARALAWLAQLAGG